MARYVSQLHLERMQQLAEAFKAIDRDGNGTLSFEEVRAAFQRAGESLADDELRGLFNAIDKDHKHRCSAPERGVCLACADRIFDACIGSGGLDFGEERDGCLNTRLSARRQRYSCNAFGRRVRAVLRNGECSHPEGCREGETVLMQKCRRLIALAFIHGRYVGGQRRLRPLRRLRPQGVVATYATFIQPFHLYISRATAASGACVS